MVGMRYQHMAVDFGTSNTIVAFWDQGKKDVILHEMEDVTRQFHFRQDGRTMSIPCIPSMIYYQNRNTTFVGDQVIAKMLENQQGAFRWMKAYIRSGRKIKFPLTDGSVVDFFVAARDFLEKILIFAAESGRADMGSAEVAFTVPVESFEDYTNWLTDTCHELGIKRYRFIDESTACIFGYDTHLQPGDIFSVFDFGGGTLDVSIVRIEEKVDRGKGCRVMGKAGCRIGGRTIDGWLYADLLERAGVQVVDARPASALFMQQVEQIKEHLSECDFQEYDIRHENSGLRLKGIYYRGELEDLMEEKGFYHDVHQTLERAEGQAGERGVNRSDVKEVLVVGGTSQIPSIRRMVSSFHRHVRFYRPFDAVARGACRYLTSEMEDLYDHIQHDYAVKSYDSRAGIHKLLTLIPRGTRYPTVPEFRKMTLMAVRERQRFFGIDIYEISEKGAAAGGCGEIMFDLNGGIVFDNTGHGGTSDNEFWMNEGNPMFIEADPLAERGMKRFSVSFRVCPQKNLRVSVRDLLTQKSLYDDYPVVKLK